MFISVERERLCQLWVNSSGGYDRPWLLSSFELGDAAAHRIRLRYLDGDRAEKEEVRERKDSISARQLLIGSCEGVRVRVRGWSGIRSAISPSISRSFFLLTSERAPWPTIKARLRPFASVTREERILDENDQIAWANWNADYPLVARKMNQALGCTVNAKY